MLVMVSNMCVPICDRFYTTCKRANSVKIMFLEGVPLERGRQRWVPLTQRHEISSR